MTRDDRQDINARRAAGSDLPKRGEGVKYEVVKADDLPGAKVKPLGKEKPKGYRGGHRR